MPVRTVLSRAGGAGAGLPADLQFGFPVRRRFWRRRQAHAHTNHYARRKPLRFSLPRRQGLTPRLRSEAKPSKARNEPVAGAGAAHLGARPPWIAEPRPKFLLENRCMGSATAGGIEVSGCPPVVWRLGM